MAEPFIKLKTPLGVALRFRSMTGGEEISRPFEYSVVASAKPEVAVKFADLLGQPAQVTVTPGAGSVRHYHGLITAASYEGHADEELAYRLTVRPWLWLLMRSANVRIFQKMSVPDILKKVFGAPYSGKLEDSLQGKYRKREYCVQYRESDFNFVSRLMEEEGIFYFFKHGDGHHTLVLADAAGAHVSQQAVKSLDYRAGTVDNDHKAVISHWRWSEQLQSTKASLGEYSFQRATSLVSKSSSASRSHAHAGLEVYDHPASLAPYPDEAGLVSGLDEEAAAKAKIRLDEQQSRYALAQGSSNSTNLCAGARLTLAAHPVAAQNQEYVLMSTQVKMSMGDRQTPASHSCDFTAFDSRVSFRPARLTPKPQVAGPQTAVVVGPSGEEIYVDKHGRVKVQFHWDREGKKDANSSCFVRVAQPAAGKGWGMVFLPRIGQEVIVDFLEGDPDQPLVTGRVYNATNMPPYQLPDKKTVSTIKSRSTMKGGANDFNELRFDDLKGSEYLLMQSQKDKLEFVKETVKTQIGKDQHLTVKKDRKEKVEGEYHLMVTKDVKQKLDGKYSQKVAQNMLLETGGLHSLKAAQDITAQAGTAYSVKAGTDIHIKSGTNVGVDGGTNIHIKAGVNVVIEGGVQLTIKAGAGSVVLGPDGVSITGPMVKINSGGSPGSGAGASPVAPTAPEAPADPLVPEDPLSSMHG